MGNLPYQFDTRVKRIHELMGDGDDVRSWPGTVGHVHLATSREDVRDALHRPEFERSDFMAQVCGDGLLFSDGNSWRERRRLAQPLFHERVMSRYRFDMAAVLDGLTKRLDLFAKSGEPIDLLGEMVRFTVGTLYRTLFGITLPSDHDRGELLTRFFNAIGEVTLTVAAPGAKIPSVALKRLRDSLSEIDCEVKEIINTHANTETADDDLISTLQASLSEDELRDELVTFFVAGGETTANLLSWLLLLLAGHPVERARVEAELDALSFETAEPSLLQTAPTLNAAVRETMRLYPPVWLISRQAIKDTQLHDRAVSARDWVLVCTYLVQRNPEEWSDPHAFSPNRFAQGQEEPPRYTYLPFGEGRHLCLGKHFGEIEATLAAATMLKRYRLEFLDDIPLAPEPGLTLKPSDTAHMRITFR